MEPTDKVSLTYEQLQALGTKMGADIGKARELTAEDYDYPADNPTAVALWKLPAGIYHTASGVALRINLSGGDNSGGTYIIGKDANSYSQILRIRGTNLSGARYYITDRLGADTVTNKAVLHEVFNSLTSTSTTDALSANQGKVLKDLIDALDARVAALEGN